MEEHDESPDLDLMKVNIAFGKELPNNIIVTLKLIGKKWSLPILYLLLEKDLGFSDLKNKLNENMKVSSNMLSNALTELQTFQLIGRRIISTSPIRVEYSSTVFGRDFCDLCQIIGAFGKKYITETNISEAALDN
jgi:DNA-binding HxlR family transcriptional regulator